MKTLIEIIFVQIVKMDDFATIRIPQSTLAQLINNNDNSYDSEQDVELKDNYSKESIKSLIEEEVLVGEKYLIIIKLFEQI